MRKLLTDNEDPDNLLSTDNKDPDDCHSYSLL